MKTAKDHIKDVKNYCDFYLEYDTTNNLYKFNNVSVEEFDIENFNREINFLKYSLLTFLKNVEKKEVFLKAVCSEIKKNLDGYKAGKIKNFSNFNLLEKIIVSTANETATCTPKYSIEYIRDFSGETDDKQDSVFYYLITHKSITHNYKNESDFGKVKLHYIIVKYFESLQNLFDFLLSIADDFINLGIENFDPVELIDNVTRCNSRLGKFETAYLVSKLFNDDLFYFDVDDSTKNIKLIKQFLCKNFKYTAREKKRLVDILDVENEFSLMELYKDKDSSRKMKNVLTKMQSIITSELSKLD